MGKSSTINALIRGKKVPVSATPGRTKHFQVISTSLVECHEEEELQLMHLYISRHGNMACWLMGVGLSMLIMLTDLWTILFDIITLVI